MKSAKNPSTEITLFSQQWITKFYCHLTDTCIYYLNKQIFFMTSLADFCMQDCVLLDFRPLTLAINKNGTYSHQNRFQRRCECLFFPFSLNTVCIYSSRLSTRKWVFNLTNSVSIKIDNLLTFCLLMEVSDTIKRNSISSRQSSVETHPTWLHWQCSWMGCWDPPSMITLIVSVNGVLRPTQRDYSDRVCEWGDLPPNVITLIVSVNGVTRFICERHCRKEKSQGPM